MKKIRKHSKYFSFFIGLSFLLFSCGKEEILNGGTSLDQNGSNTNLQFKSKKDKTGEESFKAIFFGVGALGSNIVQLQDRDQLVANLSTEKKIELNENIDSLIQEIKLTNPNYFIDFKNILLGGDHFIIRSTIENASTLIFEKAETIFPGANKIINKVQSDMEVDPDLFAENGSVQKYVDNFDTTELQSEYDDLLQHNMLTFEQGRGFPFLVFALAIYFVAVVHNSVGLSAVAGVYLAIRLWGPSLSSFRGGGSGGSGGSGTRGGPPPRAGMPSNQTEANLMKEILIDDIVNYYAN